MRSQAPLERDPQRVSRLPPTDYLSIWGLLNPHSLPFLPLTSGPSGPNSRPHPEVYESLIEANGYPGNFSPSFSELQRNFVKHRPTKLKSLLRLVKHWYLQVRGLPGWGQEWETEGRGKKRQEPDLSSQETV